MQALRSTERAGHPRLDVSTRVRPSRPAWARPWFDRSTVGWPSCWDWRPTHPRATARVRGRGRGGRCGPAGAARLSGCCGASRPGPDPAGHVVTGVTGEQFVSETAVPRTRRPPHGLRRAATYLVRAERAERTSRLGTTHPACSRMVRWTRSSTRRWFPTSSPSEAFQAQVDVCRSHDTADRLLEIVAPTLVCPASSTSSCRPASVDLSPRESRTRTSRSCLTRLTNPSRRSPTSSMPASTRSGAKSRRAGEVAIVLIVLESTY